MSQLSLGIAVALSITCNAWAAPDIFNQLSEAKSSDKGDVTPLPTTAGWRANTWFQTTSKDTTKNIRLSVNLDKVPEPKRDQDFYEGVDVYGGYSANNNDLSDIQGNSVEVGNKNGKFSNIYGGMSYVAERDSKGNITGGPKVYKNTVIFKGQSNYVYGGESFYGDASDNTVILKNSDVFTVAGGNAMTGTGNTVYLENSTAQNVMGFSYTLAKFEKYEGNEKNFENNNVILEGNVLITGAVTGAYGRLKDGGSDNTKFPAFDKGNTITIHGTAKAAAVDGYDTLNLILTNENQKKAALTYLNKPGTGGMADDLIKNFKGHSLQDRQIHVTFDPGLNCCGSYKLVAKDPAVADKIPIGNATVHVQDVFIERSWKFNNEQASIDYLNLENGLLNGLEAQTTQTTPGTKILGESLLGTLAFINQGAEFIADDGLNAIATAAKPNKPTTFGTMYGGSSRYQTGSHVDIDAVGLVAGVANQYYGITYGGFIESGWASSDSHVADATADGNHDYYGLGAAFRFQATDSLHLDAAARLGWAKTKFRGAIKETSANYDSTALYFTGHIGAGHVIALSKTLSTEIYARYIYSILNGDNTVLSSDYSYATDAVHTHALRAGWLLRGTIEDNIFWRLGAAYEHVFGGDAKSHFNCGTAIALDAPSLAGDAGILEAGTTLKPSAQSPWSFDFGIKGYVGDRRGVTGNAAVLYNF